MASVADRVKGEVTAAMKAGDRDRANALRMVLSNLQLAAKEARVESLDDEASTKVLRAERKRRLEAAEAYRDAGRTEQAESEQSEAELIEGYLPAELGDDELAKLIDEAIAESGAQSSAEIGKAMSAAMPKVAGRADGKRVSAAVKERLA